MIDKKYDFFKDYWVINDKNVLIALFLILSGINFGINIEII